MLMSTLCSKEYVLYIYKDIYYLDITGCLSLCLYSFQSIVLSPNPENIHNTICYGYYPGFTRNLLHSYQKTVQFMNAIYIF